MKISYIIVLVLFFVGSWERSFGQEAMNIKIKKKLHNGNKKYGDKEAAIIYKSILIKLDSPLTKVIIDYAEAFLEHNPDNGASLTGYFEGDSLLRIDEWVGISHKITQTVYYFDKGRLMYVASVDSMYEYDNKTKSIDYSKLKFLSNAMCFFENEKMFAKEPIKHQKGLHNKDEGKELLARAKEFKKLLEDKRKKTHQQ